MLRSQGGGGGWWRSSSQLVQLCDGRRRHVALLCGYHSYGKAVVTVLTLVARFVVINCTVIDFVSVVICNIGAEWNIII